VLTYFLTFLTAVALEVSAGYALVAALQAFLRRAKGTAPTLSLIEKLSISLLVTVFWVSLPAFLLRSGVVGISSYLAAVSYVITGLGAVGFLFIGRDAFLTFRRGRPSPSALSSGILFAFLCVVILYLFSVQSVDTNYDFYYANYKVIGWALHDGSMSNPLLQLAYDERGYPAYFMYFALDGVLGSGSTLFTLSPVAIISLTLVLYLAAKRAFNEEMGFASSLFVLASPLTLLYAMRGLDIDLTTYYSVLASVYAAMRAMDQGESNASTWALFAGLGAAVALFSDYKGFVVLLLVPSLIVLRSDSKLVKAGWWSLLFSALGYFLLSPLRTFGDASSSGSLYLLLPLLFFAALSYVFSAMAVGGLPVSRLLTLRVALPFLVPLFVAIVWQAQFGYVHYMLFAPPPSQPQLYSPQAYVQGFYTGLPALLLSFFGPITYPFFGVSLATFGLAFAVALAARGSRTSTAMLICALVLVSSVYVFARGIVSVDNWRYFYLLVPFHAVLISYALCELVGRKLLLYAASIVAPFYLLSLFVPGAALTLDGLTPWFGNPALGIYSWVQPAFIPWLAPSLFFAIIYALTKSSWSPVRRLKASLTDRLISVGRRRATAAGAALIIAMTVVLIIPFAGVLSATAFADIEQVRTWKGDNPQWNAGLRPVFDWLSAHRATLGDAAFVGAFTDGIEYYARIPSLDLSKPAQAAPLRPYMQDAEGLRSFLLSHGFDYALLPLQDNSDRSIYERTLSIVNGSNALSSLLLNATVMMLWRGWALYELTQPPALQPDTAGSYFDGKRTISMNEGLSFVFDESSDAPISILQSWNPGGLISVGPLTVTTSGVAHTFASPSLAEPPSSPWLYYGYPLRGALLAHQPDADNVTYISHFPGIDVRLSSLVEYSHGYVEIRITIDRSTASPLQSISLSISGLVSENYTVMNPSGSSTWSPSASRAVIGGPWAILEWSDSSAHRWRMAVRGILSVTLADGRAQVSFDPTPTAEPYVALSLLK